MICARCDELGAEGGTFDSTREAAASPTCATAARRPGVVELGAIARRRIAHRSAARVPGPVLAIWGGHGRSRADDRRVRRTRRAHRALSARGGNLRARKARGNCSTISTIAEHRRWPTMLSAQKRKQVEMREPSRDHRQRSASVQLERFVPHPPLRGATTRTPGPRTVQREKRAAVVEPLDELDARAALAIGDFIHQRAHEEDAETAIAIDVRRRAYNEQRRHRIQCRGRRFQSPSGCRRTSRKCRSPASRRHRRVRRRWQALLRPRSQRRRAACRETTHVSAKMFEARAGLAGRVDPWQARLVRQHRSKAVPSNTVP